MKENGSATIIVLAVVIILSILVAGIFWLLQTNTRHLVESEKLDKAKDHMIKEAERLVRLLTEDSTPHSNAIAETNVLEGSAAEGLAISVDDISSKLNLNWIIGEELKATGSLKIDKNHYDFQAFRAEKGFVTNFSVYDDFIKSEYLETFFTPYNYFNINVCSELVLEELFNLRVGSEEKATHFRNAIRETRQKSKDGIPNMIEPDHLYRFMEDEYYNLLFPVINAQPVLNIQFMSEELMLFLFLYFQVPQAEEKVEYIVNLREISELSNDSLDQIIGNEYYIKSRLHHYIGTITWFWEISLIKEDKGIELKWIVARIPQTEENGQKIVYRLVKEEFL